jgi:hypothetical protein
MQYWNCPIWGFSDNNSIIKNNLTHVFSDRSNKSSNRFYLNNVLLNDYPNIFSDTFWDNGSVGNYWGNYTAKYPHASEIGYSGLGDTLYVVTRSAYATKVFPNATNIDRHPLMYPYDIENDTILLPARDLLPTQDLKETEPFPAPLVASISAIGMIAAAVSLLYYQKKKKNLRKGE